MIEIVEVFKTNRRPSAFIKSDKSIENFLMCDAKCERKRFLKRRKMCLRTGRYCPTRPSRPKIQVTTQINVSTRPIYNKPTVYDRNPFDNRNPDYTHLYPWSTPSVTVTKYPPDGSKNFNMTIVEVNNDTISTIVKDDYEYYDIDNDDRQQHRRSTTFRVPTKNEFPTTMKTIETTTQIPSNTVADVLPEYPISTPTTTETSTIPATEEYSEVSLLESKTFVTTSATESMSSTQRSLEEYWTPELINETTTEYFIHIYAPNTSLPAIETSTTEKLATERSTTEKLATERSTTETSTTEPSTTEPSTTEPSITEPSTTEPATTEPSTTEPLTIEASTTQASTTQASTTQASTTQASTTQASTTQASTTQASTTQASTTQASTTQASTTQASTTQASTTQASTTQASTTQASTTQASTTELPTTKVSTTELLKTSTTTTPTSTGTSTTIPIALPTTIPPPVVTSFPSNTQILVDEIPLTSANVITIPNREVHDEDEYVEEDYEEGEEEGEEGGEEAGEDVDEGENGEEEGGGEGTAYDYDDDGNYDEE